MPDQNADYFHGFRDRSGNLIVIYRGQPLDLRLDLSRHSPTGFEVGYCGSGPAQLALAMCTTLLGDEEGQRIYQRFKELVIAGIDPKREWRLDAQRAKSAMQAIIESLNAADITNEILRELQYNARQANQ